MNTSTRKPRSDKGKARSGRKRDREIAFSFHLDPEDTAPNGDAETLAIMDRIYSEFPDMSKKALFKTALSMAAAQSWTDYERYTPTGAEAVAVRLLTQMSELFAAVDSISAAIAGGHFTTVGTQAETALQAFTQAREDLAPFERSVSSNYAPLSFDDSDD